MSTEARYPVTATTEVREPFHRLVSWGAIFAGAFAGLAVHLLLTMLGLGIGAGAVDPINDQNPLGGFGVGAAITWCVSALIALWVGGWVAGRLIANARQHLGCLHGFLVWSVALIATFMFISTTAGMAVGGAAKIVGRGLSMAAKPVAGAASAVTDVAKDAAKQNAEGISSFVDEAVSSRPNGGDQASAVRAKREISYAAGKLFATGGDAKSPEARAALVKALTDNTNMTEADANRRVDEWTAYYDKLQADTKAAKDKAEQAAREAGERASKATARAGIWAFIAFVIGAAAASWGGKCGAKCRTEAEMRRG